MPTSYHKYVCMLIHYTMTILKLEKITKIINQHTILNEVSFPVKQGETFAFLGINGAGKSTTMNIITTLKQQTSGTILFLNKPYHHSIKRHIGVVFQDNLLDDDISVIDNLYHRGSLYYKNKTQLDLAVKEVIQLLQLTPLLHKNIGYCSGGEKRLISIARAIIFKPKLLILDEPTTGLDVNIRKQIWDVINILKDKYNMTIFFTSHYMEEALHADQICIIHHGRIIETKPLSAFLSNKEHILTINNSIVSSAQTNPKEAILRLQHTKNVENFSFQQPSIDEVFMKVIKQHE